MNQQLQARQGKPQSTNSSSNSGLANRGYRPKPGERSMTREQWQAQNRAQRIANNPPKIDVTYIFHGEINANGKPVGFHHRASIGHTGRARVIPGTESIPNAQGVYTAKIQIFNPLSALHLVIHEDFQYLANIG